jgi:hypothetical protein
MPRGQPRTDLPVTGLQPQGSPYRFDITPILGRCARTQLVCPMRPSRLPWGFNIMPILGRYARTQLICPMLFSASAAARLIAVVVFPLPPFPLQIAMRFTRPN